MSRRASTVVKIATNKKLQLQYGPQLLFVTYVNKSICRVHICAKAKLCRNALSWFTYLLWDRLFIQNLLHRRHQLQIASDCCMSRQQEAVAGAMENNTQCGSATLLLKFFRFWTFMIQKWMTFEISRYLSCLKIHLRVNFHKDPISSFYVKSLIVSETN